MLNKMPMKNSRPVKSKPFKAPTTPSVGAPSSDFTDASSLSCICQPSFVLGASPAKSVMSQNTPNANSIPRYGGSPVNILSIGTMHITAVPRTNGPNLLRAVSSRSLSLSSSPRSSCNAWVSGCALPTGATSSSSAPFRTARQLTSLRCPLAWNIMPRRGTTPATRLGGKSEKTMFVTVIFLLIQSIVVVTSPMGLHAPPAFAARTTSAPQVCLCSTSGTKCLKILSITIVDVRLSITELSTKLTMQLIGSKLFLRLDT
mmetsp:Transcript_1401/g.3807  ORF Transcript_1401/g.3807 Transcript_1401/m.3807 type:complete len:259 (+) Transcript_1401:537-1313(+)